MYDITKISLSFSQNSLFMVFENFSRINHFILYFYKDLREGESLGNYFFYKKDKMKQKI